MGKNFEISKKLRRAIAAGLTFVLIGAGCGKDDVNLTKGLRGLSTVQTAEEGAEEGTKCQVDEFIKSYLENLGTDMQTEEIALVSASIANDKPAVNKALATILTAELKAVVAEGLGVSESELSNFHVKGLYRDAFWNDVDEYVICFEYDGEPYSFKTAGTSKTWCFYIRAAEQGQIDINSDSESKAAFNTVYKFAIDALSRKAVIDPNARTMTLAPGNAETDKLLGPTYVKTLDGLVTVITDPTRKSATRYGGNAA